MFVKMPHRDYAPSPTQMVDVETTGMDGGATAALLRLVHDVVLACGAGFSGFFKKECTELGRRVSLLEHFLEEIRDSERTEENREVGSSCFSNSVFADLNLALQAAKRLVFAANDFHNSNLTSDDIREKIRVQFQGVTWKLQNALTNLSYKNFSISEEVLEQVELVRSQLRRAIERYDHPLDTALLLSALSQLLDKEIDPFQQSISMVGTLPVENIGNVDNETNTKSEGRTKDNLAVDQVLDEALIKENVSNSSTRAEVGASRDSHSRWINGSSCKTRDDHKKPESPVIPDDFRCPISLELMRDPVVVATGQTYERSYIQRWIDCGNTTCPKARQKLQNLTLIPNYVFRSIISQWCAKYNIHQPASVVNGMIKRSDGSFRDVRGDMAVIEALVRKLANRSVHEHRDAVAAIRLLCKRSTDNRILLAEAGAIPTLVNLLGSDDAEIQLNAVTSLLNLSLYRNNKELIMLADAVPSIVQVLKAGSMEARENAAAALFSLSHAHEDKITVGSSGAIPALVNFLQDGNFRGKKDAATALFNLCLYEGNKRRAVRAGIITALLKMLTESTSCLVDEALSILSLLASHQEAKPAIVKASAIPVLIDLMSTGLPSCKENAASILLCLCKRDNANLACLSRLGAVTPLSELAKSGTGRAKVKATSLLEHLRDSRLV